MRESEHRQARQLAEQTVRFQAQLLDATGQAIIAVDPDGLITYWNTCAESLYGWSAAEVMGQQIHTVTRAVPQRAEAAEIMAQLQRGDSWSGEQLVQRRDGSLFTALVHNSPVLDPSGALIAIIDVSTDITERQRAEERIHRLDADLEIAKHELESFSYSVSHDLRAPLRAVDGYTQALLEDYGDELTPAARQLLDRVCDAAKRMEVLIDGLLSLARLGRREMCRQTVDLSALAVEIAAELRQTSPERAVEFDIASDLVVDGDERLLRVALEHLLGNAWKFTSKHARARIDLGVLAADGERVYFVRDDGAGFDSAYADRLFGAFQRMHAATEFAGAGIGLATVQRIVHRHGGRIWAEAAVEHGATFYFTLPAPERA